MSAIARMSSSGITPPVGFCGEFSTNILVRSLGLSRSRFRSNEKPRLSTSGMATGVAPSIRIVDSQMGNPAYKAGAFLRT
jgi:hypothetical protein